MLNWFNLEQKNNIPLSHNHSPLPDRLGEFGKCLNTFLLRFGPFIRSFVCFIKFNLHVFRKRETEKPREKREPEKPRIRVSSYTHKGLEARARRARAARGTNFVYYRFPLLPRPSFSGPQRMMISIITIVFCLSSQHKGNPAIEREEDSVVILLIGSGVLFPLALALDLLDGSSEPCLVLVWLDHKQHLPNLSEHGTSCKTIRVPS